jgi:mevalonate kinase
MSKEQRKLQKRKEREREKHKELIVKREKALVPVREAREDMRKEKRIKKLQKDLEHFDQIMDERELAIASDSTLSQLEKNIEILKVLEAEHNREMQQKQKLNEELEEQGYLTLEEKIEAVKKSGAGVGGSAECRCCPKETAQVSVIKAPQNEITENS